jgi:hypothetical protein
MTKTERELKEYKSLYTDQRYAKKAFKELIGASLQSTAVVIPEILDTRGNQSAQSVLYNTALKSVKARLVAAGITREPQQAEVLIECSVLRAAFDTPTLNVIMDRTAGKVKEEIEYSVNDYEGLSDEELVLIDERRRAKKLAAPEEGEPDGQ